jgi:hypothetical protein
VEGKRVGAGVDLGGGQGGAKQGKRAGTYGTPAGSFTNSGSISLSVGGTLGMTGGSGTSSNAYVLIGNGGSEFFGSATLSNGSVLENTGNVSVGAASAIIMQGGAAGDSYAQIGDGGTGPLGGQGGTSAAHVTIINTGNITVGVGTTALAGTLSLAGGAGALSYAMIGDGGPMTPPGVTGTFATFADVINQGSIVVNVGVSTTLIAQSTLALTGGTGTTPLDLGNGTTSVTSCGAALAF